jgi:hypothetical protein
VIADDEDFSFRNRRNIVAVLFFIVELSTIFSYPGVAPGLLRFATGKTAAYWDYSTHPISIPATP